jgi:hypothetical protein
MARLMLDYDGNVDVGEQGGIVYRFESLRRTAGEAHDPRPPPAWREPRRVPPLTGNTAASNVGIALLNGFNLVASAWVIAQGLTLSNIALLFSAHPPDVVPEDGMPIALGLVPFVFSLAISALPLVRALWRTRRVAAVARENARLAVLREVLARAPKKEAVTDEALRQAWRVAAGQEPTSKDISRRVAELGGDVDVVPEGREGHESNVRYRFADLEAEAAAVEEERARASDEEAKIGKIVFASDR